MQFEWDEAKRRENIAKHGIDFRDAVTMWNGPVIDPASIRNERGERRPLAWAWKRMTNASSPWYILGAAACAESSARDEREIMSGRPTKIDLAEAGSGESDWARVDGLSDADIGRRSRLIRTRGALRPMNSPRR